MYITDSNYFIDKTNNNNLLRRAELEKVFTDYVYPEYYENGDGGFTFDEWLFDCICTRQDLEQVQYFAECDGDGELINDEMYDEPADVPREMSGGLYVAVGERFDYLLP